VQEQLGHGASGGSGGAQGASQESPWRKGEEAEGGAAVGEGNHTFSGGRATAASKRESQAPGRRGRGLRSNLKVHRGRAKTLQQGGKSGARGAWRRGPQG